MTGISFADFDLSNRYRVIKMPENAKDITN